MLTHQELVQKLTKIAIGKMPIRDFEDWFVPASWDANAWATSELLDAVYSVELLLAEYSNRHIDDSYQRAFSGDIARGLQDASQSIVRRGL